GKTIRQLNIQQQYHVNVIGMVHPDEHREIAPEPNLALAAGDEFVIIGPNEAVQQFDQLARRDLARYHNLN
ncbi:MAG TPA: TrkA C-terminal domain-containing protein, partial [Anaerolineae bacterium]|nr:TrkA C-terminal domain-containing protein [Anaerolineae bacterium]